MAIKGQDVLVLLSIVDREGDWTYPTLAATLGMSASEAHASVRRAQTAGLLHPTTRRVARAALLEFLVHGLKYVFPAVRGAITRGLPTSYAAPPLRDHFRSTPELPPIWPDPEGTVRGEALTPLYGSVPHAARGDARLYEWLVLVDAVRAGRARERQLAIKELEARLS